MEQKIRFIHTADLHLGAAVSSGGSIAAERRNEALLTLEKIFAISRKNAVELLLIAGDLLENNAVEPKFFEAFIRCVAESPNLTVVFAAGNHDPLTADSPFLKKGLPENLILLGTEDSCIELASLPVRIYGRSFSSVYMQGRANFSIPAVNDEKVNIMVLHGDFGYDLSGEYNTVTKEFIEASNMDYVALGHVHAHIPPQKIRNTYFAYPGTPEPHGFDETGAKGIIAGEISKNEFRYEFLPISQRTYEVVEVDISGAVGSAAAAELILKNLKERFGEKTEEKLYKIILTGATEDSARIDATEILTRLSAVLYFAKIRDNTEPLVDLQLIKNENSLKGRFVSLMLERIEAADEADKEKYKNALNIGLKAFGTGVKYNEN